MQHFSESFSIKCFYKTWYNCKPTNKKLCIIITITRIIIFTKILLQTIQSGTECHCWFQTLQTTRSENLQLPHLLHALVSGGLQFAVGAVEGLVQNVEDLVLPDRYVVTGR